MGFMQSSCEQLQLSACQLSESWSLCVAEGGIVSNAKCAVPHSKGLALDLAFLYMLNSRITYAPIRIPLVDHTANSAQVSSLGLPTVAKLTCVDAPRALA